MYLATNNNQMKNVNFTGYQQQVTSSTHPQNSLYNGANANYDQGLRKLLMDKPNVTHTVSNAIKMTAIYPLNYHFSSSKIYFSPIRIHLNLIWLLVFHLIFILVLA